MANNIKNNILVNDEEEQQFPWIVGQVIDAYRLNQMVLTDDEVIDLFNESGMISVCSIDSTDDSLVGYSDDTILNFDLTA